MSMNHTGKARAQSLAATSRKNMDATVTISVQHALRASVLGAGRDDVLARRPQEDTRTSG